MVGSSAGKMLWSLVTSSDYFQGSTAWLAARTTSPQRERHAKPTSLLKHRPILDLKRTRLLLKNQVSSVPMQFAPPARPSQQGAALERGGHRRAQAWAMVAAGLQSKL